jgi:hypothetical protein
MRARGFAAAVLAVALTVAYSAPAQARHGNRCTARNAHTILATDSVRIFATPLGNTAERVYGCLYSRNRRYVLGIDGDCDPGPAIDQVTVSGRYVAYVESICNIDASDDYVVVKDLRTGRNKWRAIAATGQAPDAEPSTLVSDIVVSRTGSVAWIADWDANSGSSTPHPNDDRQVRKLEPGAPAGGTLLDSGLGIEQGSLALGTRTRAGYSWLYWNKNGSAEASKLN